MTGARVGSSLTDEQEAIRDLVREFAAEEVRPGPARPTRPSRSRRRCGTGSPNST